MASSEFRPAANTLCKALDRPHTKDGLASKNERCRAEKPCFPVGHTLLPSSNLAAPQEADVADEVPRQLLKGDRA